MADLSNMKPSPACRALIRNSEGCRLTAYPDSKGIPTIGVGHTRGVKLGDRCSIQQADIWLGQDLEDAAASVASLVKVPLTQGQFDALTSFTYNEGHQRLAGSTLLILLNKGQYGAAADQLSQWTLCDGKVLPGLVKRRALERAMFLGAEGA